MNRKDAKKKYGWNLRTIRKAKGMSQDELAKRLGYTNRSSINKIETGRSSIPTDKIALTAEVLGVSPLELFTVDDDVMQEISVLAEKTGNGMSEELTIPSGSFHGGNAPDIMVQFERLSDKNKDQALTYIKYLIETQKGDDDEHS